VQDAARVLKLRVQSVKVRRTEDLTPAIKAVSGQRTVGLVTLLDPLVVSQRARIVALTAEKRLPAMYPTREFVEAGGLMAYGPDLVDSFRRAAVFVDKILKGAKPADLPVEQPTKFNCAVNLRTAKTLGLTIPQSVLIRADQVIQ
jgi:putative ABC transport system substrate-binding protein